MNNDFKLDFVGVGAAKAGTSWTAAILDEHPEACLGTGKELDYFLEKMPEYMRHRKGITDPDAKMISPGIEWLKEQFDHCEPGQVKGEYSPRYLNDPGSPKLIYDHNPKAKLLFNFRNPTEAAYSFYHHYSAFHPVEISFEKALEEVPEGREYFSYMDNIEKFLKYFPREQMHIVLMDDIKANNQKVYEELCQFLDIQPIALEVLNKRVNTAKQIRSKKMLRAFYHLHIFIGKYGATRWVRDKLKHNLGAGKAWGNLKQLNIKREKYEDMPQETRETLIGIFSEQNERLGEFLGRDLSHWSDPEPKKK
jgi:Sulfotransferase domain